MPGQYPDGVMQEHKNFSTASEPRQYPEEVAWSTSLHRNPFSYFSFIYLFEENRALKFIYFGEEEGS